MADLRKFAQLQSFTLAGSGATLGDATLTLTTFTQIDGTLLTMADFGTKGYGTIEPGSRDFEEQISFTGVTQNANGTATLTGVKNVGFVAPYTETANLSQSHAGGVTFVISNTSGFYNDFANKENDETIAGKWTFPTDADWPIVDNAAVMPVNQDQLASKAYVDSVAVAGAPNATTVVKGIVQLATDAELKAGTETGSTGASLAAHGNNFTETPTANKVPVAGAGNKIANGWINGGVANGFATLSAGVKVVEDPANAQVTSGIGKIPLGKLITGKIDESWQQTTDANITTLTGAGDASSLHNHSSLYENRFVGLSLATANPTYAISEVQLITDTFTLSNQSNSYGGSMVNTAPTGDVSNSAISTGAIFFGPTGSGSWNTAMASGKKSIFEFYAVFAAFNASEGGAIGMVGSTTPLTSYNDTSGVDALTFSFDGGKLYAHAGNQATPGGTTTEISLAGITLTNKNLFRIEYVRGTDAKFYINGTLLATLATNLPIGSNSIFFGWGSTGNTNTCYIKNISPLLIGIQR